LRNCQKGSSKSLEDLIFLYTYKNIRRRRRRRRIPLSFGYLAG
jgi:hypothetical protein